MFTRPALGGTTNTVYGCESFHQSAKLHHEKVVNVFILHGLAKIYVKSLFMIVLLTQCKLLVSLL